MPALVKQISKDFDYVLFLKANQKRVKHQHFREIDQSPDSVRCLPNAVRQPGAECNDSANSHCKRRERTFGQVLRLRVLSKLIPGLG